MPRPRFSDMLYDRRRELGLSIKQASNVLRLKEEVLIAFEEGDFDSIPKSGYAQGMLSSYARYLGLNAKTVVNQFSADLIEHERGVNSHEARRRNRQNRSSADGPLYQTPQANAFSQTRGNRTYFESRGFLPTSGGFAGDMGDFATTSAARPRYTSTGSLREERDDYPQTRPYTAQMPMTPAGSVPLGQSRPGSRRSSGAQRSQYGQGYQSTRTRGGSGTHDSVSTRRLGVTSYADGRGGDGEGRGYQSTSSRRSSRNAARTQRVGASNTHRRTTPTGARSTTRGRSGRDTAPRSEGIMGIVEEFFSDRTRVMLLGVVLACILLTVFIVTSISSCVRGRQQSDKTVAITATDQQSTTEERETSDVSKEEEEKARAEAAAAKAAETESPATERTLEVTIADGEVTWIEIEYDGKSDIAETVTGPWNRTYTVRQSITISANKPAAVTVTEGGKKLEFDDKSSGIGTISIQVAKKSDAEANDAEEGDANKDDAEKADGGQQADGSDATQDQYADTGQTGYDDWPEEEYIYTEYGYYDQYGNFYEYE